MTDRACTEELVGVLAYPKFELNESEIGALLGSYLAYVEVVDTESTEAAELPRCTDPHDQKLLVLAAAGSADVLVTGDGALLAQAGRAPFSIETAAAFRSRVENAG